MNVYSHHSLVLRKEISETVRQTMALVNNLDRKTHLLSKRLDVRLQIVEEDRSQDDQEEIILLKKAIEAISLRKIQLTAKCNDFIDQNLKLMNTELETLESTIKATLPTSSNQDCSLRKRKYRERSHEDSADSENSPSYCLCKASSNIDMIQCDKEECPTIWFHYKCVGLLKKPRNSWICPTCAVKKRIAS